MIRKLVSAAFLLMTAAAPSMAQEETDTTKRYTSPEIVITSTRTSEPLEKVPMAVSYVPASDFQTGRRYELKDALWGVPGVFTQARSGHTDVRITIRGFGARGAANRSNAGNMRGIRVLLDGIPETEPDGRTSLDLVNLDAVSHLEVLRSNSSTLYGSASGGVINLFTNLSFSEPFVETKNTVGSFNFLRNTVAAGTKIGSTNMFLAVTNTTYGDTTRKTYREHSSASQFLVTMGVLSNLDSTTRLGAYLGGTSNLFRFPGPLTREQIDADPFQANKGFVDRDERRFNRQGRLAMSLDHGFSGGHGLSGSVDYQPKVLERSERNTYRDFTRYGFGAQTQYRWTTDFSKSLQSTFMAGFDGQYQDGAVLFYSLAPGGGRGSTVQQDKQEGATTMGGYVEESVTLDSTWTIKVGGRYDHVKYVFRNYLMATPPSSGPPQHIDFNRFTPKAGISYKIAEGHSVYGNVGGGVEAPAFNEVDPPSDSLIRARGGEIDTTNRDFNPLLEPTTSTSFEVGARGLVGFDGFLSYLSYDVAAYMISIGNDLIPWDGGRYYFTAAETKRTGLELGFAAGSSIGLSLQGALTISQNKYVKYENLLGRFDDNETAGLPSMVANARLRYEAPFGIFLEGSLEHVGGYYADDRNDEKPDGTPDPSVNSLVDAYSLLGLTAGWAHDFGSLAVDLYATVNNLTDQKYVSSVFINGESNQYFESGMPRSVVVGVGLRYH